MLISYVIGAISCIFTGLAYSEFAARVPVAGSAYTYVLTSFGEAVGFIIGWNLTLEYAISGAAVARSWASYFVFFVNQLGAGAPAWLAQLPIGDAGDSCSPLAAVVCLLCTLVMLLNVKKGARFNLIVTIANLLVLGFVVAVGAFWVNPGRALCCITWCLAHFFTALLWVMGFG